MSAGIDQAKAAGGDLVDQKTLAGAEDGRSNASPRDGWRRQGGTSECEAPSMGTHRGGSAIMRPSSALREPTASARRAAGAPVALPDVRTCTNR